MDSTLFKLLATLFNIREGRASHTTIRKRILSGARINGMHICLLIVAMLIASVGLNINSTEAIVGAMLICPIMGSVMGIAYGIASADAKLLKRVIFELSVQVIICLITSTLYFVISPISTETSELLTNSTPSIWVVLIALAGGFAGGLGSSRNQEPYVLISGVAVATALMPPLCAAGYGIATSNLSIFGGAFYVFLLNVVFIAFAAELLFVLIKTPLKADLNDDGVVTEWETTEAQHRSHVLHRRLIIGSLVFLIPAIVLSSHVVADTMQRNDGQAFELKDTFEAKITTEELKTLYPNFVSYSIGEQTSYNTKNSNLSNKIIATLTTSSELSTADQSNIEKLVRLHVPKLDSIHFVVKQPDKPVSHPTKQTTEHTSTT
ncbi:DUF389 domain-containing protein [Atopobium fossor]|uniref:DUF389 domain-containing protein n=1 Tax=Atopobium fossor TaxID=39487 RepID=UPI0004087AEC|nr:DUF389 domain-containing protein [Atopobium fossor]